MFGHSSFCVGLCTGKCSFVLAIPCLPQLGIVGTRSRAFKYANVLEELC